MKFRTLITMPLSLLLLLSLWGCSSAGMNEQLDAAGAAVEARMDMAENAVASAFSTAATNTAAQPSATAGAAALTKEEAQAIALEHAGFTEDQVTWLRTEYEIDDGVPQYEVQFHQGRWEYDYEINADTGAILSYDRDD